MYTALLEKGSGNMLIIPSYYGENWSHFLYYKHKGVWVHIKHQQGLSHFWKGILKSLDSFVLSTKVILENGKDTASWKDFWSIEINLANLFPQLFQQTFNHDVSVFDCRFPESIQFRRNLTGILADKFQEIQQLINRVHYANVGDKKKLEMD